MRKKAIVLGGSKGIGKGIADSLESLDLEVVRSSRKEIDTSNIESVENFISLHKSTDILVLNTGGPPKLEFSKITVKEFENYHNQLFLGFVLMLQKLRVNDDGFIFLISSYNVKEPDSKLLLSNSYRIAFTSILKSLSKEFAKKNINTINIAPGPIDTDRIHNLVSDINSLESRIPLGRLGSTKEIGLFVKSIIENNIKYLTGVTINFDGGKSNFIF